MPYGSSRQLRSHDALACSLKAVAVARVVLCCDGATARQCAAATDARLHFPSRSCWIDAADPDHCKNRTRRPLSLTGVAHARGSAAACGWRQLVSQALFRSEEHTSELQSLMRISYAVFCLK